MILFDDPELKSRPPRRDECGATDGFSFCTEPPDHGPVHWDRSTQHEWSDRDPSEHRSQ